jgi:hypothetical protein
MIFTECSQRLDYPLYVSSAIKSEEACTFLQMTTSVDLLCKAITTLTSPQLYDLGILAIQEFHEGRHHYKLNVNLWTSVWTRFSMIVNRITPFHKDGGGAPTDYDLLVSSGTHKGCVLNIPDIGLTVNYLPGTAVLFIERILRHGVVEWEDGERICQACFCKRSLQFPTHLIVVQPISIQSDII